MRRFGLVPFLIVIGATASATEWIEDPSSVPLRKWGIRSGERIRILGDFDGDGFEDMALSYDTVLFGNAGGHFWLYLGNAEGKFRKHGVFPAHPKAVSIEKFYKKYRIWTHQRGGGGNGVIGYYDINEEGLSEWHGIKIHPGDSGTAMGNAIYRAVFDNSDVPLRAQRSKTENGKVAWQGLNDQK